MFERYTEKARRVIFFARYEASQHGKAEIDTPCLLLGILREDKDLMSRLLPSGSGDIARLTAEVEEFLPKAAEKISTSVDLPLSNSARRALVYGAEESNRLKQSSIHPGHLLFGLLREDGPEAKCLLAHGVQPEKVRAEILRNPLTDQPDARQVLDQALDWVRGRAELVRALREMPADRREAAATLLEGLASGKFEASGTSRNGPFHFSFEDKAD